MGNIKLLIPAAFGLESVVASELKSLGYRELQMEDGGVYLDGTFADIPRLNLNLRAGERVKMVVGRFDAPDFDTLFDGISSLPWLDYLSSISKFPVTARSVRSQLTSEPRIQATSKKAIANVLMKHFGLQSMPETGDQIPIDVAIRKDKVTVTIDTTGPGLHKRGYRLETGEAPLKETLAASLLLLSKWRGCETLFDPFCGSGTIVIEGAMLARSIPPGAKRSFLAEAWDQTDKKLWDEARRESLQNIVDGRDGCRGSDINQQVLEHAKANADRADVKVDFNKADFRTLPWANESGTVICNPPYGERLQGEEIKIHKDLGKLIAGNRHWVWYVLTPIDTFERFVGAEATRRRKLYNGRIKVDLYQYEKKV